jgi:hypothetical protein
MNEEELEQLGEDWLRMREEISSLKADVRKLIELVKLMGGFVRISDEGRQTDEDVKEFRKGLSEILNKHNTPK